MSFQETRSELSICNKALSRIMQQPLSGSLTDPANQNKLSGRECVRWYKHTVREIMTKHHFGMATKRVALAQITNERAHEWGVAYQAPSDMAFPVSISPYEGASEVSYYRGLGFLLGSLYGRPLFRLEQSTIWSLVEGASLDYTSFNITEADFTSDFEDIVVTWLASHLAEPIAKDRELATDLRNEALSALNLAIANNLNINGQRYDNYLSDAELARGSTVIDRAMMGWRY